MPCTVYVDLAGGRGLVVLDGRLAAAVAPALPGQVEDQLVGRVVARVGLVEGVEHHRRVVVVLARDRAPERQRLRVGHRDVAELGLPDPLAAVQVEDHDQMPARLSAVTKSWTLAR